LHSVALRVTEFTFPRGCGARSATWGSPEAAGGLS
jgi:hypothetical protein